jgi:hypothetical protein
MVTTKDRTQLREELIGQGYSWEYVDGWQPKITLYRHAPVMSEDGQVVTPVGTKVSGLPGNPDYVLRKARLGMLPYPVGESCECKWCVARNIKAEPVTEEGEAFTEQESVSCQVCDEVVTALTKAGALSRLRVHMKLHESAE